MNATTSRHKTPSRSWLGGKRSGAPRRGKHIQPYDRFVKVAELLEAAQTVWTVWQTIDLPGLPAHVKLVQERSPHRQVTVAVSALADRRYYRAIGATVPASTQAQTHAKSDHPAADPLGDETEALAADAPARSAALDGDAEYPVLSRLFEVADRDFEGARAANLLPFKRSVKEQAAEPALAERI